MLARDAGFKKAWHVPGNSLAERYFTNRSDGLRPSSGEDFLLASSEKQGGNHHSLDEHENTAGLEY